MMVRKAENKQELHFLQEGMNGMADHFFLYNFHLVYISQRACFP